MNRKCENKRDRVRATTLTQREHDVATGTCPCEMHTRTRPRVHVLRDIIIGGPHLLRGDSEFSRGAARVTKRRQGYANDIR